MTAAISWRRIPMGSHDQGVHNTLILNGLMPDAKLIPNGQGRVLTMGGMTPPSPEADGRLRLPDGRLPAVLHQYDRFPELAATLRAAYVAS
jgi:hypothetical protein